MTERKYRGFDAATEMDALVPIMSEAFGGNADDSRRWLTEAAPHCRVLEEDGRIRGGLALYPLGHWFGGRSVPARGVAGVGIDAADRGRGVGTEIMRRAVREMHDDGVAISSLYPAVLPVYRRAGYERAGHTYMVHCRLRSVAPMDRSSTLRRGTSDDEPALEELERRRSRLHDGNIDRTPFMWRRTRDLNTLSRDTFVVEEADGITGYLRVRQTRPQGNVQLSLKDVVATTPGAARRILAFLADHASQIEDASWFGHPSDPLQSVADALCFDVRVCDVWMLRITHVESALTARGYPSAVSAEVHLDLEDDLCPANAGAWTLRIDDGLPTVERGGAGRVRLHVRDLAPIYSGYKHPLALRATRRIEGTDDDLRTLGAVFAGGAPWMQETF